MNQKDKPWLKVDYMPEPYDCFSFVLNFETGQPGDVPIKFGLGPSEARQLKQAINRALLDRMRQGPEDGE